MERIIVEKECFNCGNMFTVKTTNKNRSNEDKQFHFCPECRKKLSAQQKKVIIREKCPEVAERYKKQRRAEFERNYIKQKLFQLKRRAEQRGLEFNLDESDIIIPEKCPILEVPLVIGKKNDYMYSPSIDRIDNTKGYIKGNIQVISMKANTMKNSATPEELVNFCKNILRYSLTNRENEPVEQENKESLG